VALGFARMLRAGLALATLTPGHVGGSETYVRGLLSAFAAGHGPAHTTVLAHAQTAAALGLDGSGAIAVAHLRGGGPPAGGARRAAWLLRVLAEARARPLRGPALDVVHAPLTIPVPRVAGARLVVTLHDVTHHERPSAFSAAERAFRRVAYDDAARRAALVVTVSEHARAAIVAHLGIAPERVVAIHHGIDHRRLRPEPDAGDERRLADLALPERFVIYPANLWPHKNHERLLEALATTSGDVALVLTGQRGPRWAGLVALARRLGVAGRLHHAGYLPDDAMAALYRRAAGLVFPSLAEGFGAPPLEAMACGCPVAASDAGAVAEVTGDAALHFDAGDPAAIGAALDRLDRDEALRTRLRAAGPQHAAGFTWAACGRRHGEAYESAR
jgi:glycosyltransferase involved in cell wall biosynthesis